MTSKLQPINAGIVPKMKLKYQKRMVRHLLGKMDKCEEASQLSKQISVLDIIQWTYKGWREVEESTISKCYKK